MGDGDNADGTYTGSANDFVHELTFKSLTLKGRRCTGRLTKHVAWKLTKFGKPKKDNIFPQDIIPSRRGADFEAIFGEAPVVQKFSKEKRSARATKRDNAIAARNNVNSHKRLSGKKR